MENKQMIHIASEIVALVGLTFYFNQKNKKLLGDEKSGCTFEDLRLVRLFLKKKGM